MDWKGEIKISAKLQPDRCITFECQNSHFDHDEKIPWYFKWYISPIVNLIVKIVVSCISDDLIDSIKKCSSQIKVDKLNTVAWCDQTQKVTSAYLSESLVCIY